MSADFKPTPTPKNGLTPFKYWVQHVLPVVYDDSLSYQELLSKVVDYLNHTIEDVNAVITDVDNLNAAYGQLEDFVNEYFDNLDVQEQIDNKLDEMALDGSLTALISPFIPNLVTSWLNDNVNPVGSAVMIDSSLSISGAAADAKVTGKYINDLIRNMNDYNIYDILGEIATYNNVTMNDVTFTFDENNRTVTVATLNPTHQQAFANIVESINSMPEHFEAGNEYYLDYDHNNTNMTVRIYFYENGTVLNYISKATPGYFTIPSNATGIVIRMNVAVNTDANGVVNFPVILNGKDIIYPIYHGDANTLPNGIYYNNSTEGVNTIDHLPLARGGWVETIQTGEIGLQWFYPFAFMSVQPRIRMNQNGTWSEWVSYPQFKGETYYGTCDEINESNICFNSRAGGVGTITDYPIDAAGWLITSLIETQGLQIAIPWNTSYSIKFRARHGGYWEEWVNIGGDEIANPEAKLFSIGNSILTGSVWLNGSFNHLAIYPNSPYGNIASAMNIPKNNVHHELHSSTGLLYDAGTGNFLTNIKNTNLSEYDCLLTHLWTADASSNIPFGDLNSTANDGSLIGAVLELLNYIDTNNNNCQLILLGIPPVSTTIYGDSVFTGLYGNGKSIAQMDTILHQLAEREHFVFVDYEDWRLSYNYHSRTDGLNVHLNNEDTYRAMGGYLGGKVSSQLNF